MSDENDLASRNRLMDGLNYLRRHALEAFQSGDGPQVLHNSALALRQCERFGQANPNIRLKMEEIHWAFVLGMYCMIGDWFLMLVSSALEQTDCVGDSSTDRELVVLIHNLLFAPHGPSGLSDLEPIPCEWWTARSRSDSVCFEEDRVALSFLAELVWYRDPVDTAWERLITHWLDTCPAETVLRSELEKLRSRLRFQAGLFTGAAFNDVSEDDVPTDDVVQRDLFLAWNAYFNCEWERLNAIHSRLKHRVSVEHPAYVALFHLQHFSLPNRHEPDDQFVALPRVQIARSRQPAQLFQHFRDAYASSQFLSVANAGFPQNANANERKGCLRIAMLCSLEGLRTWDIGDWISIMRDRAEYRLELGALGDTDSAIEGILDSVRGRKVPDRQKCPRFDLALAFLDTVPSEKRSAVVSALLQSPPAAWRDAASILRELSDSIPEDMLGQLAEWSLRVEATDLLTNHLVHTLMDVWNDILPHATQGEELVAQLAPVLRKVTASVRAWDNLHDTILAAILLGPERIATELVEILISTNCDDGHWNQYRFSIALNVVERRPVVGEALLPFLRADLDKRDNLYQQQLLKRHAMKASGKVADRDPAFRRTIVNRFVRRLSERQNLQGPIPMGGSNFYNLSRLVSWPRSEPALVDAICESIDSETVLFSDKVDYLAFLGNLVRSGPLKQAQRIASNAVRWLQGTIPGRDVWPKGGGPLSAFQISSPGQSDLTGYLLFVCEQSAIRCPEVVAQPLVEWLPLNVSSHVPKFVSHFLGTVLALGLYSGKKSGQDAALLVGLADTAGVLGMSAEPRKVVDSFRYVVLNELVNEFSDQEVLESVWGRTLFRPWSKKFETLVRHPSVEVREGVARGVAKWTTATLPFRDDIEKVAEQLRHDYRIRVRNSLQLKGD